MPCRDFWCTRTPRQRNVHLVILFSEIMNEMSASYLQNMLNFQLVAFLNIATQSSLYNISCPLEGCLVHDTNVRNVFCTIFHVPQKDVWCMIQTCAKFFSPEFDNKILSNLSLVVTQPFQDILFK